MYRKMQAANADSSQLVLSNKDVFAELGCVEKARQVPVVGVVAQGAADAYGRLKASHAAAAWAAGSAEAAAASMGHVAAALLPHGPLHAVDRTLCAALDMLQQKVPLVKEHPQEIMNQAKERVGAVTNYGWNKANDMLSTKWGMIALSGFDATASIANNYLDTYLPPQEKQNGVQAVVEVGSNGVAEDKVGRTLHTMGELSGKVRSGVYQALLQQLQGLKLHSETTLAHLSRILDGVPKSKEAAEEEARRLAHNVSTFLASVPDKIGHLMPAALAEQVRQAQQFGHLLYENLLDCTLRNMPDSIKDQTNKLQTTIQDVGAFAAQLMETFKAKEKEITEAGAQMAIED